MFTAAEANAKVQAMKVMSLEQIMETPEALMLDDREMRLITGEKERGHADRAADMARLFLGAKIVRNSYNEG